MSGTQYAAVRWLVLCMGLMGATSSAMAQSHDVTFYLDTDLYNSLTETERNERLQTYVQDLNTVFSKQTGHTFSFIGVVETTEAPTTAMADLSRSDFPFYIHAELTDNPNYGTYGGYASNSDDAAVATGMKWDQVHDPTSLTGDATEQYWRQIHTVAHEFMHSCGAGLGEYYNLANISDTTATAPVADLTLSESDPYWGQRTDYFTDPLLHNIYDNPLAGSPTTRAELLDTVRLADVTAAAVDGCFRESSDRIANSLPDLSTVTIQVTDEITGEPITDATVQVWNVDAAGSNTATELDVTAAIDPGEFEFEWVPYPEASCFSSSDAAKLIKIDAPDYEAEAMWYSIFDCQQVRLIDGMTTLDLSTDLRPDVVPEPSTIALLALGTPLLWRRRKTTRCPK